MTLSMESMRMVDCHVHVFDPARFPYAPDTYYAPAGQELGTPARLAGVLDWHGVDHAVLVGPNSGYGEDNRCLLDTLAAGDGRYRGMAVVDNSVTPAELAELKAAGVLGVTVNAALLGVGYYADAGGLLADLAALDMIADVQVVDDQLVELAPLLERSGVRVHVDHCGRPDPGAGRGPGGPTRTATCCPSCALWSTGSGRNGACGVRTGRSRACPSASTTA